MRLTSSVAGYRNLVASENSRKLAGIFVPAKFAAKPSSLLEAGYSSFREHVILGPGAPLTPMVPMTLPSTISGLPPRDAITSSSVVK